MIRNKTQRTENQIRTTETQKEDQEAIQDPTKEQEIANTPTTRETEAESRKSRERMLPQMLQVIS